MYGAAELPLTELAFVFSPITTTIWLNNGTAVPAVPFVVNDAEAENTLDPEAQTVCTWNSYDVLAVSPVIAFELLVAVVAVHALTPD